ncbi:Aste57867_7567 [Aphanomyces stellatus]|uniref:Aste57867_7567 protein n=1 Tax=Aphanomyces stellatus TaxID=120398 RepID=A0A485KII5_9STRA|nr:hypothetical protein As57867_007541 [Aphanomyces stellatus]VFT84476.1 Aste57867_7567 [Aphanomyces stellatus]
MHAAFASHALSEVECKRILATGEMRGVPREELKKDYMMTSIDDFCGPGLWVLRKRDEPITIHERPEQRRTSWFSSLLTTTYSSTTSTLTHTNETTTQDGVACSVQHGTGNVFMTSQPRHMTLDDDSDDDDDNDFDDMDIDDRFDDDASMTTPAKSSMARLETTHIEMINSESSFQSPVATISIGKVQDVQYSPQVTTPAAAMPNGLLTRLRVHLPSNDVTPLAKTASVPEFGISPILGDNKKKAVLIKKRQFDDVTPEKLPLVVPPSIPEGNELSPEMDNELDIVMRHEVEPARRRSWPSPDFFKRSKPTEESPAAVASPSSLEELLNLPPDTSSLWARLKSIRMPDLLAEGLSFHGSGGANDDDEDDENHGDDDLCCGFDLMNVDGGATMDDDPHPLTLEFSLTHMTPCDHESHPAASLPTKPASPPRRVTRSQRRSKRLAKGVSLSNLTCCELEHHEWGRFSTCGRMHGRWTPPKEAPSN